MICVLYALGCLFVELRQCYFKFTVPEKKLELARDPLSGTNVISDIDPVSQHDSSDSDDHSSECKCTTNEATTVTNILLQNSPPPTVV